MNKSGECGASVARIRSAGCDSGRLYRSLGGAGQSSGLACGTETSLLELGMVLLSSADQPCTGVMVWVSL